MFPISNSWVVKVHYNSFDRRILSLSSSFTSIFWMLIVQFLRNICGINAETCRWETRIHWINPNSCVVKQNTPTFPISKSWGLTTPSIFVVKFIILLSNTSSKLFSFKIFRIFTDRFADRIKKSPTRDRYPPFHIIQFSVTWNTIAIVQSEPVSRQINSCLLQPPPSEM